MFTLGILADTHIPDRFRSLHPQIIPIFRQVGVNAILHAGDISIPSVLDELRQVAEVYAVRGNRDWLVPGLPMSQQLIIHGVKIVLTHSHSNLWHYLSGHLQNILTGRIDTEAYHSRLQAAFPEARVIVYGHLHLPANQWRNGQLLFNPGSPHILAWKKYIPSIGLLYITEAGEVDGKIVSLD